MGQIQGIIDMVNKGEIEKPKRVFLGFEFKTNDGGNIIIRKFFLFFYVKGSKVALNIGNPFTHVFYNEFSVVSDEEDARILFEFVKAQCA